MCTVAPGPGHRRGRTVAQPGEPDRWRDDAVRHGRFLSRGGIDPPVGEVLQQPAAIEALPGADVPTTMSVSGRVSLIPVHASEHQRNSRRSLPRSPGAAAPPRYLTNQSPARDATCASVPGSSNRWLAP